VIELREGLFWSYVDQGRAADAGKVLDDMRTSLPPAKEVRNYGPEESDYLRYYRLRAQYLIVTGHVDEGIAALEQLEKEVPFNAEIRAAHADAVSGQSHPRQAISMYRASLTDHPDSVEMLAGLAARRSRPTTTRARNTPIRRSATRSPTAAPCAASSATTTPIAARCSRRT
jgi:hypothetical protein